ncbi:MAG: GatB/YqeY domain-containing protein [Spirochaetes bacterium]|nr:GatB/YqeY domain-containing protein [Spirochaetota bacterium]
MKNWKKELDEKIHKAMKEKDEDSLRALKMLKTELTNEEVKNEREELEEEQIMEVIQRAVNRRKESIEEFKKVGKEDRVKEEEAELKILMQYMPEQMSKEEVARIVDQVIEETKAESMKDMGKVMGKIMPQVKGKADGKMVNEIVKQKLGTESDGSEKEQ